jgi:hypothetical protein
VRRGPRESRGTGVSWRGIPAAIAEVPSEPEPGETTPAPADTEVSDSTVVMDDRLKRPRSNPTTVTPAVDSEVNDSTVVMDDRG